MEVNTSTQKPIYLYNYCLKYFAKKGDKILDTHLGSGTNRIACYINGFDFIGIEKDPYFFFESEKFFNLKTQQQFLNFKD